MACLQDAKLPCPPPRPTANLLQATLKGGKWSKAYHSRLLRQGLVPLALEQVQPGSERAVATGADGQAYALTAVGTRLWGQTVRAMFGSAQAAARVPLYWSTQELTHLEAGDGWLQQAQRWE